jgi:hypothetical protein
VAQGPIFIHAACLVVLRIVGQCCENLACHPELSATHRGGSVAHVSTYRELVARLDVIHGDVGHK